MNLWILKTKPMNFLHYCWWPILFIIIRINLFSSIRLVFHQRPYIYDRLLHPSFFIHSVNISLHSCILRWMKTNFLKISWNISMVFKTILFESMWYVGMRIHLCHSVTIWWYYYLAQDYIIIYIIFDCMDSRFDLNWKNI